MKIVKNTNSSKWDKTKIKIPFFSGNIGQLDPKLYRSISLDSYDFTTLSDDFLGKIYFKVSFSFLFRFIHKSILQLVYCPESEMLTVSLHKLKYLPELLTKHGVSVKYKNRITIQVILILSQDKADP